MWFECGDGVSMMVGEEWLLELGVVNVIVESSGM